MTAQTAGPRERILATACRLFAAQGYRGTGINQIIEEAGVAKASFYHHFPSKDALGLAWLEAVDADSVAAFSRLMAEEGMTADERLERWVTGIAKAMAARSFRGCPYQNMAGEYPMADAPEAIRARMATHKRHRRELVRDLAVAWLREAGVTPDEAESRAEPAADALFLLLEGAVASAQITTDRHWLEAALAAMRRHLRACARA
ncbi:MAG: TetR/AcrR family transcriptional regulator [Opitutales bacterium]